MKFLVDMNLSPLWVEFLARAGIESVHWSAVGSPRATDAEIMAFARDNGWIVLTHDLDFSALLAHARAGKPSVVQLRAKDVLPAACATDVIRVVRAHAQALETGAILSVDTIGARLRILPIGGLA
jgi:predicted nuclease of predicted toxin-antitoxin system